MILVFIADGRSIHTQRWAAYFADRGHEVHLITYDPMNLTLEGVTEHVMTSRWNNLYLAFFPRHFAIKRLVKRIRPDLIHAHFIAKYGFHLPDLKVKPAVVSAWGDDILILPRKSRLIFQYTKNVLDYVDLVYAVSRNIGDHIVSDFEISDTKVVYLPFGIDTDVFHPVTEYESAETHPVRIFSNRGFFPVYDTATLVRGFALAYRRNPAIRLTLKGEGPEEQQIRDLVTRLGMDGEISFLKKTSYAEVPRDYREADIFITTSVSDGTPVSVLEAMASGLPCIATAVGGIPEWIEHGVTGLLVAPGSPDEVAEAILTLAGDPALRHHIGTAARDVIVKNGQWKNLMAQAEKDYLALIETYRQDRQ